MSEQNINSFDIKLCCLMKTSHRWMVTSVECSVDPLPFWG